METIVHKKNEVKDKRTVKASITFLILFILYHLAEYMIMFRNEVLFFFTFQILFFISAVFLGRWYSGNGLAAWGLPFTKRSVRLFLAGMGLGVLLYAIPYCTSILLGIEQVIEVPEVMTILKNSLPFAFGVLFTSVSEDVLTRGIIYSHFHKKIKPLGLVLLSSSVYLFNHIYRLTDGPETLSYLFLLGVVFIIPVLFTRSLWLTAGMHWAGNVFFFISHAMIRTEETGGMLSSNTWFAICLLCFVPVLWVLSKKIFSSPEKETSGAF